MKTIKLNQMENKITEEELKELVDLKNKKDTAVYQVGVLEQQKHQLLHALAGTDEALEGVKKKLEENYGPVNINLTDGSYETIESTEAVEAKA